MKTSCNDAIRWGVWLKCFGLLWLLIEFDGIRKLLLALSFSLLCQSHCMDLRTGSGSLFVGLWHVDVLAASLTPLKTADWLCQNCQGRFFFVCWEFGSVCVIGSVTGNQVHIRHFHTCLLVFIAVVCSFAISYTLFTVSLFIIWLLTALWIVFLKEADLIHMPLV